MNSNNIVSNERIGIIDEVFNPMIESLDKTLILYPDDADCINYKKSGLLLAKRKLTEKIKADFHKLCYDERLSSHRLIDEEDIIKLLLGERKK